MQPQAHWKSIENSPFNRSIEIKADTWIEQSNDTRKEKKTQSNFFHLCIPH